MTKHRPQDAVSVQWSCVERLLVVSQTLMVAAHLPSIIIHHFIVRYNVFAVDALLPTPIWKKFVYKKIV